MRSPLSLSKTVALCLCLLTASIAGGTSAPPASPAPRHIGLTNSLTTSGYHFWVGLIAPPTTPPGHIHPDFIAAGPSGFEASYLLANHTGGGITFTVPRPIVGPGVMAVYVPNIVFSIYDANSKLVWSSWTNPGNFGTAQETLGTGAAWKLTSQIPLKVNNLWLNGAYTLVASVNGTPDFSATTTFVVSQAN